MYDSNRRARNFLLEFASADAVWLKSHTKRKDRVFTQDGHYNATDLFNLFDGIAISKEHGVILFQVKTDAWPRTDKLNDFARTYKGCTIWSINVRNVSRKGIRVFLREYPYEKQ